MKISLKRSKINRKANAELVKLYDEKNVKSCEVMEENCQGAWALSFHHRHKRVWYYDKPDELLWSYNQTLLCCAYCHDCLEYSKDLHEYFFGRLRGKEEL